MAEINKLRTPTFRVAFPSVFEPRKPVNNKPEPPTWQVTAIFNPEGFSPVDKARWLKLKKAMEDACKKQFNKPIAKMPSTFKRGLRPAEEKENFDGFEPGMEFINLTTKRCPAVLDVDDSRLTAEDNLFYAGCYAQASVTPFAFDQGGGKGVALMLWNLKKVDDGEEFSGGGDPVDDFLDEDEDGDEDEDEDTVPF